MAISKVIYGEDTLIDLTADTVTPETLAAGTTAHNSAGETVVGTVTLLTVEEITQQAAQKVDKESLGLSNVNNTSDMDKPVSTAQLAALAGKAPAGYADGEHDTVIAQGASGIWTYRKWASGVAECWASNIAVDGTDIPAGSYSTTSIALPFTFIDTSQACQISLNGVTAGTNLIVGAPWKANETAIVRVINNSASVAEGITFDLHIIGRWK